MHDWTISISVGGCSRRRGGGIATNKDARSGFPLQPFAEEGGREQQWDTSWAAPTLRR
jgi:hypothetical protein